MKTISPSLLFSSSFLIPWTVCIDILLHRKIPCWSLKLQTVIVERVVVYLKYFQIWRHFITILIRCWSKRQVFIFLYFWMKWQLLQLMVWKLENINNTEIFGLLMDKFTKKLPCRAEIKFFFFFFYVVQNAQKFFVVCYSGIPIFRIFHFLGGSRNLDSIVYCSLKIDLSSYAQNLEDDIKPIIQKNNVWNFITWWSKPCFSTYVKGMWLRMQLFQASSVRNQWKAKTVHFYFSIKSICFVTGKYDAWILLF